MDFHSFYVLILLGNKFQRNFGKNESFQLFAVESVKSSFKDGIHHMMEVTETCFERAAAKAIVLAICHY